MPTISLIRSLLRLVYVFGVFTCAEGLTIFLCHRFGVIGDPVAHILIAESALPVVAKKQIRETVGSVSAVRRRTLHQELAAALRLF